MRDCGLADPAQRQRGDRDSELRCRQIGIEIGQGTLQCHRVHATLGDQLDDATAAHRYERKLGGNEEAVGGDENENGQHAAELGHIRPSYLGMSPASVIRCMTRRKP